jgi:peptidoglycan/xylan/chitin deacetylase (PgdA/CDA1 family)
MMRFLLWSVATVLSWPPSRQVAITFDDLPLQTRLHVGDVTEQQRIVGRLVRAINAHNVPAIGFVNENKLAPDGRIDPRRVATLEQWNAAGIELGNHSYSHLDLHIVSVGEFTADVARGDSVTRRLLARASRPAPRWFRHPFLHTGRDTLARAAVEQFLAARGYRVAPVTMDNYDYLFAAAYERALGDRDASLTQRNRP